MNTATYCPEDNKLRLYVGRVPRDEYERLRAEGWTSTPKQSCDFVAHWTPERAATCLEYADLIEDEDQSPEERAADRAERFSEYRDKRTTDAGGYASRYESQPLAHGFQNEAKAERAAARHDRIADHACDAWSKAEYWQRRTAGVIRHALYKSTPAVRMGRIKELEAQVRKIEASYTKAHEEHALKHSVMLALMEHAEGKREKMLQFPGWQYSVCYIREADGLAEDTAFTPEQMRRCMLRALLSDYHSTQWEELCKQVTAGSIEAATAARQWLDANGWGAPQPPDFTKTAWHQHLTLRLAYENQMLEAQGGRAAFVEMEVGGWVGSHQIHKVNKSNATGRVVSVGVMVPTNGKNEWGNPYPEGTDPGKRLVTIETERMASTIYRAPSEEEKAAFAEAKKAAKKAAPKKEVCPLINPTDEDAERLQALWNERARARHEKGNIYSSEGARKLHSDQFKPKEITRITQATYSANSKGSYARAETRGLCRDGNLTDRESNMWSKSAEERAKRIGAPVCNIRVTGYDPYSVIVLTDKPQKPLPAAVWVKLESEVVA